MLVVPILYKYVYTKRVALQVHHRNHDTMDNRLSGVAQLKYDKHYDAMSQV
jgi:hypothetical protein